jgi:hypothetical protein
MFLQWGFFLVSGQVPELQSEPIRITFHLAAELITAIGLLAGGIGLLRERPWAVPVYLVATGLLLYSVVVSPGYFAQQGQWAIVGMFGLLLLMALWSIVGVVRSSRA